MGGGCCGSFVQHRPPFVNAFVCHVGSEWWVGSFAVPLLNTTAPLLTPPPLLCSTPLLLCSHMCVVPFVNACLSQNASTTCSMLKDSSLDVYGSPTNGLYYWPVYMQTYMNPNLDQFFEEDFKYTTDGDLVEDEDYECADTGDLGFGLVRNVTFFGVSASDLNDGLEDLSDDCDMNGSGSYEDPVAGQGVVRIVVEDDTQVRALSHAHTQAQRQAHAPVVRSRDEQRGMLCEGAQNKPSCDNGTAVERRKTSHEAQNARSERLETRYWRSKHAAPSFTPTYMFRVRGACVSPLRSHPLYPFVHAHTCVWSDSGMEGSSLLP